MKNVVVCYEEGKFSGWPANGGVWCWGNEILVSFNHGTYHYYGNTHNIDREKPIMLAFARSLNGGESWEFFTVPEIYNNEIKPIPEGGFDFSNPGFVLRVGRPAVSISGDTFIVSYDRGHTWDGPFAFPDVGYPLTSRTCYHIEGPKTMRLFASLKDPALKHMSYSDQAFTFLTEDGGVTWQRLPFMTTNPARAAMPDVVKLSDGTLVAALRRKTDRLLCTPEEAAALKEKGEKLPREEDNWIEIERSADNGQSWTFGARAAETAHDMGRNGNPPALAVLPDDRLVLVFGYRGEKPAIKARVSCDGGYTWGEEIILRDDPAYHDIGYPRVVVRPDGKLVAMYYFTSEAMKEQHIEATIFEV